MLHGSTSPATAHARRCDTPPSLLPSAPKTTTAAAHTTTALAHSPAFSASALPSLLLPLLPPAWQNPSARHAQTNPLSLPPALTVAASARSPAPPTTSAPLTQKSCPAVLPVPLPIAPSRSPPPPSPPLPAALRTPAPHTHPLPAAATSPGPPSRSPSAASAPSAHTPPAPCAPA